VQQDKKNQFTDKYIKSLPNKYPNKKKPFDEREKSGGGFAVTVFPSNEISFIYIYHFGGRKRRMTLGKYPHMSLANAHKTHRKALKILEDGKDPAIERKQARLEERNSDNVQTLIDEYLEEWAKPRKRSWKEDQRILYKDVSPKWGKQKAKDITKRDVILLLEGITKRGAPITANRTLACIRRMFNFGVERDLLPASPCATVKAPSKENRRERHLTADEIKIFWHRLDNAPMSELTKLALKLQLVTAQRKGEIVSSEWNEIDLVTGIWTIPAKKAKNGKSHRVPLSELAIDLLNQLMAYIQLPYFENLSAPSALSNNHGGFKKNSTLISTRSYPLSAPKWLFPANHTVKEDTHMTGEAIDHALRRSKEIFKDIEHFSPHTLRATATSHMAAMKISGEVLSRILNHSKRGVTEQHYNKYDYDDEKRHALDAWSKKLQEIIYGIESNANVIPLKEVV
jgi:integrase